MASPVDAFKSNLFGQLKSYGDAVQGVFEQRIARPLLALKRDLSRPPSTIRTCPNHKSELESPSASSPTEPTDLESNGSLKTIFDKVKNTLSPSITKRVVLEVMPDERTESSSTEQDPPSISSQPGKDQRNNRLRPQKSVSFAENVPQPTDDLPYPTSDREGNEQNTHDSVDPILVNGLDGEATRAFLADGSDCDFQQDFRRAIKPRRVSIGNGRDLAYQDLSAEIVAYILKHALRTLEQEDEELRALTEQQVRLHENLADDDFIDLK